MDILESGTLLNLPEKDNELVYFLHCVMMDYLTVVKKNMEYGVSWKKRGGVGAFMMLARKWDRLETMCHKHNYDVFLAAEEKESSEDLIDTIRDLRNYCTLIENELMKMEKIPVPKDVFFREHTTKNSILLSLWTRTK